MATLTFKQLEDLWINAGGSPILAPEMAAIAEAESSGRSDALNNNPATGDYSVGPWQINYYGSLLGPRSARYGSPQALLANPSLDAAAAVDLAQGGKGLHNWSTWKSGAYEKYMPANAQDIKPSNTSFWQEVGHVASFGIIPANQFGKPSASNLAGTVGAAGKSIFDAVANPIERAILRGVFIIGGFALLLVGLYLLAKAFGAPIPNIPVANAAGALGRAGRSGGGPSPRRRGDAAIERGEEVTRTGPPERVTRRDQTALNAARRKRAQAAKRKPEPSEEIPF